MATTFSWTNTAQIALGPCMPCLRPVYSSDSSHINRRPNSSFSGEERPEPYNPAINHVPRARPDQLQGLLADSSENVGLVGHGYVFVKVSLSLSIPAIERRLWAPCIRPSCSSRARRRRGRSGRRSLRAQEVKERHSIEWRNLGLASSSVFFELYLRLRISPSSSPPTSPQRRWPPKSKPPNPSQGQIRRRSRPPFHHLRHPRSATRIRRLVSSTVEHISQMLMRDSLLGVSAVVILAMVMGSQ